MFFRIHSSTARYPARPNIHDIADSSPQLDPGLDLDPLPADVIPHPDEEYSYQDEAEAIASISYDNDEVIDDFNYVNRAVVYSDVLDQKSHIQYVHETYFYPNQDPASFSALATSPVTPINKKDLPCFKFANQNCDLGESCPYGHKKEKITEYLNSHHAGVTRSKKAVHDKNKETFKAYNKTHVSTASRPPQIYSNTRPRPTPVGQGHRPTMSAMWHNPAISLHNFNDLKHHYDKFVITDGIGNELHERLELISGLNLLDSALHSDCVVTSSLVLQDGSKIECRTLADTGCTHQCFMSEENFNKYPILKQSLVPHPTNTIDLATLGSTAVVSQYISVVLEIVHRGTPIHVERTPIRPDLKSHLTTWTSLSIC